MKQEQHAVIFFDGVCNLCNASVSFIIRHDKQGYFLFAPLQSKAARKILAEYRCLFQPEQSIVLLQNGRVYFKSTASLRIAKRLDGLNKLFFVLILVPPFIRDFIYDVIARKRYRWFGKREKCMVPTEGLKSRFVESED